ncbi:hypothetical protein [Streptomyces sp. MN6]
MRAALDADSRRTPPTERADSLATIRSTKTGALDFEARDALARRIEHLYADREQLQKLITSMQRIADAFGSLLHDLEDPGTEALCAHYELRQLLAGRPAAERHTTIPPAPSAQRLREQSWQAALRADIQAIEDQASPGDDSGDFYTGLLEDLLHGPVPPLEATA